MKDEKVHIASWTTLFRYVQKTIRNEQADIAIYGYVLIGLIGWILRMLFGKKYVISTHGMDMLQFRNIWGLNKIVSLILRHAEGVLTNSEFTRKQVISYGVDPAHIELVFPGVEDVYERGLRSEELIAKHGLEEKYVLLTVGRLVRRKGYDYVIQSLPEVIQAIPNAVYLIVGDGPERNRLRQLAEQLGVLEHVLFVGYIQDVETLNAYYNTCHQFIMIPRELEKGDAEGFGIVYLEAASSGIPVIAGNSGGVSEAVLDGQTGLLVNPISTSEISAAIILMKENDELRSRLVTAGYERVKSQFRYIHLAEKFDRAMSRFVNMSTPAAVAAKKTSGRNSRRGSVQEKGSSI
jgi:phosphatidylinositol alpha-1,6-mannosyltransferase